MPFMPKPGRHSLETNMDGFKSILTSKTVWAAVVAIAAGAAGIWGYSVAPADQATLVELLAGIGAAVGGAGAIWARIVASKQIG